MKEVNTIATKNNYNRYIKKYPVEKIFALLLHHQYVGMHCGRNIDSSFLTATATMKRARHRKHKNRFKLHFIGLRRF
ncbi:MAG: hypothetical protein N3F66_09695 [Spirochaetes bacterium]|nr:hypothetical protein [Spirochaetota bacterium]